VALAVLITHFFGAPSPLYADLSTGLVAYYPFNGNANDVSGHGNNGAVNGATLSTDRFGSANSAYALNGGAWIGAEKTVDAGCQNTYMRRELGKETCEMENSSNDICGACVRWRARNDSK